MKESTSRLSLLALCRNDNALEQKRLRLFVESLLNQEYKHWELILWDSSIGQVFEVPEDPRITLIRSQVPDNEWYPAVYKNKIAQMAKYENICHVNADCVYAPNFVSCVLEHIEDDNVVYCWRWPISEEQFADLNTVKDVLKFKKTKNAPNKSPQGECMAMRTKTFMTFKGFYHMIGKENVDIAKCLYGFAEDVWLYKYVQSKYSTLKECFIDVTESFMVHLGHPVRPIKRSYAKERKLYMGRWKFEDINGVANN